MKELTRVYNCKERTFRIYERHEADEAGIEYVYWQQAEPGEWALTDDGFVGQCLKRKHYDNVRGGSYLITFSFARKWMCRGDEVLHFARFYEHRSFSRTKAQPWGKEEAGRPRMDRALGLLARFFIESGGRLTEKHYQLAGRMWRDHDKDPVASIKVQLRNEHVMSVFQQKIAELLSERGIDEKAVIEGYEEVREQALEGGKALGVAKSVLDVYAKWLGMGGVQGGQGGGQKKRKLSISQMFGDGSRIDAHVEEEPLMIEEHEYDDAEIEVEHEENIEVDS